MTSFGLGTGAIVPYPFFFWGSPNPWIRPAAGYVLGDLTSDEAELFQTLLAEVPKLYQEVAALQEALALMPYEFADVDVDSRVRSQLLTKAEAELSSQGRAEPPLPSSPFRPPEPVQRRAAGISASLPWVISTVAASLAVVCGLVTVRLSDQVRFLQAQSERTTESASLVLSWSGLDDILQDHEQSLTRPDGPVDFVVSRPSDVLDLLQGFQTTMAALPLLPTDKDKLLGGSNCQFGKIHGLRLTYQLATDQTLSAYQLDVTDQNIPELPSAQITLQQPDGTSLVLWRDDNYIYALVATLPLPELQTLAHAINDT